MDNTAIFISACAELKVRSALTDEDIERLRPEDWSNMIQTLQLFAQKLENKDPSKKSFKVSLNNLKISIDQLQKEWDELKIGNGYDYDIFEDDIYQSPYEDTEFGFFFIIWIISHLLFLFDFFNGILSIPPTIEINFPNSLSPHQSQLWGERDMRVYGLLCAGRGKGLEKLGKIGANYACVYTSRKLIKTNFILTE